VTSTSTAVVATVYDGDNSLSSAGFKASAAVPGEYAVGYNSRTVSADTFTYTITGLVPGSRYYASVSAINAYGISTATTPTASYVAPPEADFGAAFERSFVGSCWLGHHARCDL
jgi:hypothetical protein